MWVAVYMEMSRQILGWTLIPPMEVHGIVRATLGSGACFYSPKYRKGCVNPIGSLVNWTDSVWKNEWSLVSNTALPHGNCDPENNHWAAAACWWRLLSLELRAQWVKYPSWGQCRLCHPSGFHTMWACCALHLDFLPAGTCPLHFTLSPHVRPAELFLPALSEGRLFISIFILHCPFVSGLASPSSIVLSETLGLA